MHGVRPRCELVAYSAEERLLQLRLTFERNGSYCCCEPGCHIFLHSRSQWERLRSVLVRGGAQVAPESLDVHVLGVVEAGARFQVRHGASEAFDYEATYCESKVRS